MPIATGIVVTPPTLLPIVIPPVDPIAAVNVIMPVVTLGGQILNSPQTDPNGIAWVVNEIDGWDAPDVRTTQTQRGNDHGLFQEGAYYGGRLLIVKGSFASITGAVTLMAAREQLHAAMNVSANLMSAFTVQETPPKTCMVQRMSGSKDKASSSVSFDFELHLLAPDPRKYAAVQITTILPNVTASITNAGTMETRPLIAVQGPATAVYLENLTTGQTVTFGINMLPADVLYVDLDLKGVSLNGGSASWAVQSAPSQWWTLQPGVNYINFGVIGQGSTTQMQVQWRSAWI